MRFARVVGQRVAIRRRLPEQRDAQRTASLPLFRLDRKPADDHRITGEDYTIEAELSVTGAIVRVQRDGEAPVLLDATVVAVYSQADALDGYVGIVRDHVPDEPPEAQTGPASNAFAPTGRDDGFARELDALLTAIRVDADALVGRNDEAALAGHARIGANTERVREMIGELTAPTRDPSEEESR